MSAASASAPRKAGKRTVTLLAVVFGLVGAIFGLCWLERARSAATEPHSERPTTRTSNFGVGALGRLEPGWKVYQVASPSTADGVRVQTLLVDEGDEVESGELLAVLDTAAIRAAACAEARGQVCIAQAKLAQAEAGTKAEEIAAQEALVTQLQVSATKAQAEFKRAAALLNTRSISTEDHDQRQFQSQIAQANVRQAEATLAALRRIRPEDIEVAKAEVVKAEAGLAHAEADLEATNIRAPVGGRVLKVYARAGEKIGTSGLLELGDTACMQAVADVYERDAPHVEVGQRAFVRVQSLREEIPGSVVRVGWKVARQAVFDNDPVKDTDARVVEVRIQLDNPAAARVARLSNARVEVRIDTHRDEGQ